ncbi:hypothetical protein BDV95DRAFT_610396 [Massariosphaeria phaeospora]|uniref:Uncharacterized protein n=1 Tax=Massariosphaeria phaeospora TaxID=100035 RepID=A0A7C8I135_9PLEO|nr:hypothetical protein BDV95DRAFT_610396 [Massariosphaeria phaeospora]
MVLFNAIAGFSLASIALASPPQLHARQNASSPCAQVSASVAAQAAVAVATPTVAASLAYSCITSVPFNQSAALDLLASIVPYFRWQSNTVWLKDPPKEYAEKVQPAVDIWGGLKEIKSKAESGSYDNEFDFGFELYTLLQSTHDGHFVFVPDVVGTVFNWARPVPLVSISNGKDLPKPFVYPDVLAEVLGNTTFTPSAITKINGEDALEYLEKVAQRGSLQDRDALYNNVFYQLAAVSLGPTGSGIGTFAGSGRGRWVYPGPETKLEFENGTSITYTNFARVLIPFDGISSGEYLYSKWFTESELIETEAESAPAPSNSSTPTASSLPAPGYPPPVIREENNLIGGYYLEKDYSDVAVLSVPSFVGIEAQVQFQQTAEKFLGAAKAAGKKKLIIDVSANGGGTILLGYDLYKLLFPRGVGHAAGDRFRAFESTDLLGHKFSKVAEGLPRELADPEQNETLYNLQYDVVSSIFNYQTDVDVNDENFESWEDKFGPVKVKGDNFSSLIRWNLSDVETPLNSGGIFVHGYGKLTNYTQPFAAEDIVVVSDGYCASTCTIFSELMRQRAGVKYISLGGRAKPGITQAVGGVKGTNNFPWDSIQFLAQYTITNLSSTPKEAQYYNSTELGEYWSKTPFVRQAIGSSINVNFRDGIRDGDETQTPLQFVYEAADCRILYTKEMTVDITAIWKAAADSTWGGKSHCIAGDLGGYGKKTNRRSRTAEDKVLERRMKQWRKSLNVADYPLDLYTDLTKARLDMNGYMWP